MTFDNLTHLVELRRRLAKEAAAAGYDLQAKEHELVASLAEEVMEYREKYGAIADKGFLAG